MVTPIPNGPECRACHSAGTAHLGVLIIDAPLANIAEHMREDQIYNMAISLIAILLVVVLAYIMIQWLVVKRVEVVYKSLSAFAGGDFSVRVPKTWRTEDEITQLAEHFNVMLSEIERRDADLLERQDQLYKLASSFPINFKPMMAARTSVVSF